MAEIKKGRWTAQIDGDFVVFLIGARFDFFHLIRSIGDLGGRRGMFHMLDYLLKHPEKGLLGYESGFKTIVQSDRTGIWHETYLVRAGDYEAIYGNMPPHGLGKATRLVPVAGASSARTRIRAATHA